MVHQRNRRIPALEMDSSVPLTHHDLRDLGLICVIKKHKIHFRILSDLTNPILDFLKETHPYFRNRFQKYASAFQTEHMDIPSPAIAGLKKRFMMIEFCSRIFYFFLSKIS